MTELVYDNGYVNSTGVLFLGAPCVAPILEFANQFCEPVAVTWQNRLAFGDDDIPVEPACASRLLVAPGELALLANFYPGATWKRSLLTVEGASSGLDAYVFWFGADRGYYLERLPFHWTRDPTTAQLVISPDFATPPTSRLSVGTAYRPGFSGNFQPIWKNCLFLPVSLLPLPRPPPVAALFPQCHPDQQA